MTANPVLNLTAVIVLLVCGYLLVLGLLLWAVWHGLLAVNDARSRGRQLSAAPGPRHARCRRRD